MATTLKNAVNSAEKLLDKTIPGWKKLINTKKLVMCSNEFCILGQIGRGNGHRTAAFIDIDVCNKAFCADTHKRGEYLKKLWLEELRKRKG